MEVPQRLIPAVRWANRLQDAFNKAQDNFK